MPRAAEMTSRGRKRISQVPLRRWEPNTVRASRWGPRGRVLGNFLCLFKKKHSQGWVKVLFGQQLG